MNWLTSAQAGSGSACGQVLRPARRPRSSGVRAGAAPRPCLRPRRRPGWPAVTAVAYGLLGCELWPAVSGGVAWPDVTCVRVEAVKMTTSHESR